MDMQNDQMPSGGQNESDQSSGDNQQGTDINMATTKRSTARLKLAVALMAIGGTLAAAAIWLSLYARNSGN